MEQVVPKPPVKKAWPLMTPAERLAIWEDARLAWTYDAEDVIAHIEGAGMKPTASCHHVCRRPCPGSTPTSSSTI